MQTRTQHRGPSLFCNFLPFFPQFDPLFLSPKRSITIWWYFGYRMREESHSSLISRNILLTQAMLVLICYVKNVRNHNEFVPTQFLFSASFMWVYGDTICWVSAGCIHCMGCMYRWWIFGPKVLIYAPSCYSRRFHTKTQNFTIITWNALKREMSLIQMDASKGIKISYIWQKMPLSPKTFSCNCYHNFSGVNILAKITYFFPTFSFISSSFFSVTQ